MTAIRRAKVSSKRRRRNDRRREEYQGVESEGLHVMEGGLALLVKNTACTTIVSSLFELRPASKLPTNQFTSLPSRAP